MKAETTLETTAEKPNRPGAIKKGEQRALRHGLNPLKKTLYQLGYRVLDKRTVAGRALVEWRDDLVRDLGGEENISTQQDAIILLAIKTKLLLDSIDVWLLEQPTLIIKRKRAIIPAVGQRQALADALARYMAQLGSNAAPSCKAYLRCWPRTMSRKPRPRAIARMESERPLPLLVKRGGVPWGTTFRPSTHAIPFLSGANF